MDVRVSSKSFVISTSKHLDTVLRILGKHVVDAALIRAEIKPHNKVLAWRQVDFVLQAAECDCIHKNAQFRHDLRIARLERLHDVSKKFSSVVKRVQTKKGQKRCQ